MTMITIAMVFEMMMMMMMVVVVVVVVVVEMTVMDDDDNDDEDDDDDDDDDDEVYNLITFTDLGVCYSPRPDRLRRITPSSISLIKYSNYTQPQSIIAKYKAHYWTKTISQWLTVHE